MGIKGQTMDFFVTLNEPGSLSRAEFNDIVERLKAPDSPTHEVDWDRSRLIEDPEYRQGLLAQEARQFPDRTTPGTPAISRWDFQGFIKHCEAIGFYGFRDEPFPMPVILIDRNKELHVTIHFANRTGTIEYRPAHHVRVVGAPGFPPGKLV